MKVDEMLKPCPFCGKKVKSWDNDNPTIVNVIVCENCKVKFVFPCDLGSTLEKHYIKIFNSRKEIGEDD